MNRLAAQAIRDLDAELERVGALIKLERMHDAPDGASVSFFAERVPAKLILRAPQTIDGAFPASSVIISPTTLARRQWPMPPRRDDRIWIGKLVAVVRDITEFRIAGDVVRYQLTAES